MRLLEYYRTPEVMRRAVYYINNMPRFPHLTRESILVRPNGVVNHMRGGATGRGPNPAFGKH